MKILGDGRFTQQLALGVYTNVWDVIVVYGDFCAACERITGIGSGAGSKDAILITLILIFCHLERGSAY